MDIISIIIPIYNAEQYIARCIESVISQSYRDIEIILVNDGSTDLSGKICDDYAKKDKRILVIHQENKGVVTARNIGIKNATGEWLAFVDADDWIEPNMYELLISETHNGSDIIWCDVYMDYPHKQIINKTNFSSDNDKMLIRLLNGALEGWSVNKIIKRHFYKEANINIDVNCKMMEDTVMSVQLMLHNPKMEYLNIPLYHYNLNNVNSTTNGQKGNAMLKAFPALKQIHGIISKLGNNKIYMDALNKSIMRYKISLASEKSITEAKVQFQNAHKRIDAYPISNKFVKFLYWTFFNIPYLGKLGFNLYRSVRHNN